MTGLAILVSALVAAVPGLYQDQWSGFFRINDYVTLLLSGLALAFALGRGDVAEVGSRLQANRRARWIAGFMFVLSALAGAFWILPWARFVAARGCHC